MAMRIVVGLGNPGGEYAATRHNLGWWALDALAERWKVPETEWWMHSTALAARVMAPGGDGNPGTEVWLVKPATYMNRSGSALCAWWRDLTTGAPRYDGDGVLSFVRCVARQLFNPPATKEPAPLDPAEVLVLVDDVNLAPGALRLRAGGSGGGHNGLSDLTQALGTEKYPRLRIGVGGCPAGAVLRDWVLGVIPEAERVVMKAAAARAAEAAECWVVQGLSAAQSRYNGAMEDCQ